MGCGYDCESALLLCAEDNSSVLGLEEGEVGCGGVGDDRCVNGAGAGAQRRDLYGDFFMGFPLHSDEHLTLLLSRESCHLPKEDYARRLQTGDLDLSVRREAISWIEKAHFHFGFGPLSVYLSVNYLDRFLSYYDIPKKEWMTQLLSVTCLSLAAKMDETEVPLCLDLQQVGESKFIFEARTIQRMELLVLSTLNWRMQAVTPFSFIDYFLCKLNDGKSPPRSLLSQSAELILKTINRIDLLEFRPSEIAAAVALYVFTETHKLDVKKFFSFYIHISKDRAFRCYEVIKDITLMCRTFQNAGLSVSSVPQSPVGILDAGCLSYRSDDATVHAETASHHTIADAKRRKVNR